MTPSDVFDVIMLRCHPISDMDIEASARITAKHGRTCQDQQLAHAEPASH